jgi:WD40-like Beta Propeller Repeat
MGPAWSPDGTKIAYTGFPQATETPRAAEKAVETSDEDEEKSEFAALSTATASTFVMPAAICTIPLRIRRGPLTASRRASPS